jgi:hypothetical protein
MHRFIDVGYQWQSMALIFGAAFSVLALRDAVYSKR